MLAVKIQGPELQSPKTANKQTTFTSNPSAVVGGPEAHEPASLAYSDQQTDPEPTERKLEQKGKGGDENPVISG